MALPTCWAALGSGPGPAAGGTPTSLTTSAGTVYTRLQRTLDGGVTVQEYVDRTGAVFAVSWSGPFLPDLQALLGASFDALASQQAAAGTRSSAVAVQRADLVILSTGRTGAFRGQAWLPKRLPTGFDTRSLP